MVTSPISLTGRIAMNETTGKICVSIAAQTVKDALAQAATVARLADVIEIRLDCLGAPEIDPFMEKIKTPLLFTNRPEWEGGFFKGDESRRVALLEEAINKGAAYVDIELKAALDIREKLLDAATNSTSNIIISWHNYDNTPSPQALASIFQAQYRSGAHIGKIVTKAHDFRDVLTVLELQSIAMEMDFPLISFCMGRVGTISRIATLEMHGYMTYAAPDDGEKTAPGQLPVSTLKTILKAIADAE